MTFAANPTEAAVAALLRGVAGLVASDDPAPDRVAAALAPHWPAAFDRHRLTEIAASSLLADAERIATGGVTPSGQGRGRALRAIMASVMLSRRDPVGGWHEPDPLSAEAIMPARRTAGGPAAAPEALRRAFVDGWSDLCTRAGRDAAAFEEGLLSLCGRLLWSLPAGDAREDLPLFDQARLTAALAAALVAADGSGRLRLLVGDLSGLQDTLFRLRSERVEGLAKLLRGRSARFQLIAEAAQRRALASFALPMSCALQSAGGRFLAVVPALADADARVQALREEADRWFAAEYLGGLSLGLALSPAFDPADLAEPEKAAAVAASASVAAETAKLSRMAAQLAEGLLPCGDLSAGPCPACDQHPAQGSRAAPMPCPACAAAIEIGGRLPHAEAVLVGVPGEGADRILGIDLLLPRGTPRDGAARGWRWLTSGTGQPGPAPLRPGPPWVARFADRAPRAHYEGLSRASGMTLTTPEAIEAGEVETFECLALDALEEVDGRVRGRPLLALLKGDVDRLGQIFAAGLAGSGFGHRMALSRMIDLYFTLRLPHLLGTDFPQSYTLYAGGDDFVLILPWRQGLALARRLREDFEACVCGNPDLTFSLGVALFEPHLPISIAAREAEERLTRAKDDGRNRVSAVEPGSMTWEDFAAALDAAEDFNAWLRDGTLSAGAVYHLLALEDARRRVAAGHGRGPDFGWRSKLAYHIARQRTAGGDRLPDRTVEAIRALFGLGPDWRSAAPPRPGARLALTHALYRNR